VDNNKRDIDKFGVDLGQHLLDYKAFKEAVTRNLVDQGSAIEMESMLARIAMQSIGEDVQDLKRANVSSEAMFKEKIQKVLMSEGAGAGLEGSTNPEVEEARKIQNAFEKLRNDNLFIWKQSLELAQKEFTEKGVGQTMNLLPKTILDRNDLKRTVNSLIMEDNAVPKPQIMPSPSQTQLSVAAS
jgi:hypothetical protein